MTGTSAKPHITVVGAVLVRGGKVLAARRGPDMTLPGRWEFPGGKVEDGESHREALAREVAEELLCEAKVGAHIQTTMHEYHFAVVTLSTYVCTIVAGEPQATEHAELRWFAPMELGTVAWAPADVPTVTRLHSLEIGEFTNKGDHERCNVEISRPVPAVVKAVPCGCRTLEA